MVSHGRTSGLLQADERLYFLHIPKTAGTSLRTFLESRFDVATLTGGVVVALGSTFAGMWCDDDKLRRKVEDASEASGERVWRLAHHQEYRDMMKSPVAGILNSNPNRKAHPIQGATF